MHINLLTSKTLGLYSDDVVLLKYLESEGCKVTVQNWEEIPHHRYTFSKTIIRSCWNYTENIESFIIQLEWVYNLHNKLKTIQWNLDKSYLKEFEWAVPTSFNQKNPFDSEFIIIKPQISNGGHHVLKIASKDFIGGISAPEGYMIQPFLDGVYQGETSLIYFGETFSHAIHKTPESGQFRVQHYFGGSYRLIKEPDKKLLQLGQDTIDILKQRNLLDLYCRLDFIPLGDEYLLSEIEMIEPLLHFTEYPEACSNLFKELKKCV